MGTIKGEKLNEPESDPSPICKKKKPYGLADLYSGGPQLRLLRSGGHLLHPGGLQLHLLRSGGLQLCPGGPQLHLLHSGGLQLRPGFLLCRLI